MESLSFTNARANFFPLQRLSIALHLDSTLKARDTDTGMSFATLASGTDGSFMWNKKGANSGFVGLTVKEDVFTRMANKSKNDSGTDGGEEGGAGGEEAGAGGDDNYDPHYEPIIKLPDEIEVRTGEEDEVKLFGERAKLFRYDSDTKEWKERGVGELKILHHPGRSSYRLLMRREQIFKLVLNHAISSDLQITSMNNSGKAFIWGAMNHAEEGAQLEKLAARFKNEDLAASFKSVLEQCQEKLRQKPHLEPDQD